MHQQNIIHRDLKLENILLDNKLKVKIADFGLSVVLDRNQNAEGYLGTPLYMAPEIWKNQKSNSYNHKVDIYSLGIILLEIITQPLGLENRRQIITDCKNKRILPYIFQYKQYEMVGKLIIQMTEDDPKIRIDGFDIKKSQHYLDWTKYIQLQQNGQQQEQNYFLGIY